MKNLDFLNKALSLLKPPHNTTIISPLTVEMNASDSAVLTPAADYRERELKAGDKVILDFRNHHVGYLSLRLGYTGSHPDAPVLLKLRFAERPIEFTEHSEAYQGWVSASWIQEERIHVDVIPGVLELPRRYAFRYVEIEVLAISSKYSLVVEEARLRSVSGADDNYLVRYSGDEELRRLDQIACRTLHSCMQTVFEDGPKRDRRLWMGDLRLQALANYQTYHRNDMVKACLYLFAALPTDDGRVGACLFLEPEPEVDDTVMFDYSLLFVNAALDYYRATGDIRTLAELKDTAFRQIDLAVSELSAENIVKDSDKVGWCFIDWNLALNKQTSAQGVLLYALKAAIEIAAILKESEREEAFRSLYDTCRKAAREHFWDEERRIFVSGADRQVSWASQIWMILGGVCEKDEVMGIFDRLPYNDALEMVTPYLYHHYVEALLLADEKKAALSVLKTYWGGMAELGADTFWELYNPENPDESPYGGTIVNSYCHAWSCAPAYFLRRYY